MSECFRCDNCGWVCENHSERLRVRRRRCSLPELQGHDLPRLPFTPDDESKRH
jgi:hypothetical protein